MKSLASILLLVAGPAFAQEPPPTDSPHGSSQAVPGEARFDEVGQATIAPSTGMKAAVRGLAAGSFAEVTALDSGRTMLVLVEGVPGDDLASLSPAAASALGLGAGGPVRVRRVTPTPQDAAALRQERSASARIDAPPALLGPLRKRLQPIAAAPIPPAPPVNPRGAARPQPGTGPITASRPRPAPSIRPAEEYWVQVAALANGANARSLAARVGGTVVSDGRLHKVRIGPLPDAAAAQRARARAAALGYRDAAISRVR